ncbi:uncharacterized protein LAESUDRAFT_815129 [Laetiporus sulphureus 93-53]|uniref:Uncharacterized protein n=1 Tax=Laetiporus sulphureus 93-53 TaxID=1314785 RepID=A0A165CF46_9APHY|nr:uncharacterized protein LAESUDRAFT_815129 [Laetiporus sulphureus 93-53]KZT02701.1 hypothetical protein LAESUDRAFT_815129 [Laetiporus sulphureus 93-53]
MPPISLRVLLEEPFGPYMDSDVLTEACKSVPKSVLCLDLLMLECRGKPIGLTQCELSQPEFDKERVTGNDAVRFRGTLRISQLRWLTAKAIKQLNNDIRNRDVSLHLNERSSRLPDKSPTLEDIYANASGFKIKIVIQGVKNMSAVYLMNKMVPNGLYMKSFFPLRNRDYEVRSMEAITYHHSRKYLARYRALHVLEELIKIDRSLASSGGDSPASPFERLTPEWFCALYKEHMAKSAPPRVRRKVYDSDDSDIEPDTGGRMKAGREHVLRHVPEAEIYSLLAAHAEWILDQEKQRMRKTLDIEVWTAWVRKARGARLAAQKEGVRWGKWDDVDRDDGSDGDAYDEVPPERLPQRRKTKPKSGLSSRRQGNLTAAGSHPQVPLGNEGVDVENLDASTLVHYDSDFSPPSTPPASPSSSEASLPSRSSTPYNPEIIALIPAALYHRPMLPSTDFTWICPIDDCYYEIQLLDLTDENCKGLVADDTRRLKTHKWHLREEWVQSCFYRMVSVHFEEHLTNLGITMIRENNMPKFVWMNPARHKPWPPSQRQSTVKQEEEN